MSDAHGVDEIRKHVKSYYMIFAALLVLTMVTVGVSYLHLSTGPAIVLALAIATVKGALVSLFLMHLSNERRLIYSVLAI